MVVVILVFAGTTKLRPLTSDVFFFGLLPATAVLTVGLVCLEAAVAFMLLRTRDSRAAWLSATVLFTCFAIVAIGTAIDGQRSCGCFGTIAVGSWLMGIVDSLVALSSYAAFVSCPTRYSNHGVQNFSLRHIGVMAAGFPIVVVTLLLSLTQLQLYGVLPSSPLVARYSPVPVVLAAGEKRIGLVTVEIANARPHQVQVAGTKAGCDTQLLSQLPLTLAPGECTTLAVSTRLPETAGHSTLSLVLYTAGTSRLEQLMEFNVTHE